MFGYVCWGPVIPPKKQGSKEACRVRDGSIKSKKKHHRSPNCLFLKEKIGFDEGHVLGGAFSGYKNCFRTESTQQTPQKSDWNLGRMGASQNNIDSKVIFGRGYVYVSFGEDSLKLKLPPFFSLAHDLVEIPPKPIFFPMISMWVFWILSFWVCWTSAQHQVSNASIFTQPQRQNQRSRGANIKVLADGNEQ